MKLLLCLILLSMLNVSGSIFSQSATFNLAVNGKTVKEVFRDIESQSDIRFLYNDDFAGLNKVVNINSINKDIEDVLSELLIGANLTYRELENELIVITPVSISEKQERTVRGKVTDEMNATLPGVSVIIRGTTIGTVTDVDGNYVLTNVPVGSVLVFSYVGMRTQEVLFEDQTNIDVKMIADVLGLEEVVTIGYGTARKDNLTGSMAIAGEETIRSVTTPNVVTGLAGKLPGLRVLQRTSEPGAYNTTYDIRGYGTPMIVVDGIVRSDFVRFDVDEIESITVLKDATAAVYGVKAANGVILVTTKKGDVGKPTVSYSTSYGFQWITNNQGEQDVGTSYDFAVLTTEMEIFEGKDPDATSYSPEDLKKFLDGTYPPGTDWLALIYRNHANVMRHNLNISGGSERIKYFTSIGYLDELGMFESGDLNYQRYNVRSSVTGNITDDLSVQLNLDGHFGNKNSGRWTADQVHHFTRMNKPIYPVYANNTPPYLQDLEYPFHPLACIYNDIGGYRKDATKTFQTNASLNYDPSFIDGLSTRLMFSYYTDETWTKQWFKEFSVYTYDALRDTYRVTGIQNRPSSLQGNFRPLDRTLMLGQASYEKTLSQNHNVKAMVAFEARNERADNLQARKEFAIDVDQFFAGVPDNTTATSSNIYENANQNVIGRFNYDFMRKYLFEFGFNYGGSSMFPKGSRWGFFPYASVGWRLSHENFIAENLTFVDNLMLRVSYGQMGDDGASAYQFITGYNYPSGNYVFGNQIVPGLGFRGMPNPNITWFTVTTKNIGLDLSLFQGLFSMGLDLFQRDRSGLLATRLLTIPASVGAALAQENLNKDMTKGFELVLGHSNRIGELTYNISTNLTYTRSQRTYIERAPDGNSYLNWRNNTENRWTNMNWGYNYIGQFQKYEEILSSPIQDGQGNRTLRPGDLKYEDVNGDGIISSLDMVPIGRSQTPDMYFGLNFGLAWKNFDMNLFFQGAAQFNRFYGGYLVTPLRWGRNSIAAFNDRWRYEDIYDVTSPLIPGYYPQTGATVTTPSNRWASSFWRPNANYLRFKNMEIGYNLSGIGFTERYNIQNIRVYVSAFNIYTFTKLRLLDPEHRSSSGEGYPITLDLNLGLNVTF